jgi:hypothetical protein
MSIQEEGKGAASIGASAASQHDAGIGTRTEYDEFESALRRT